MGRGKNGIPDRWLNYSSMGTVVPGTRFIACKVPLNDELLRRAPPKERFGPTDLLEAYPNLGLLIDLTNTTRYYKHQVFTNKNIQYEKIFCPGQVVPPNSVAKKFFDVVDRFLETIKDPDSLIAVHCTHGINRTGYLICRYMIQRLDIAPDEAIKSFQLARGHGIERKPYVDDLTNGCTGGSESHMKWVNPLGRMPPTSIKRSAVRPFNSVTDEEVINPKRNADERYRYNWRDSNPKYSTDGRPNYTKVKSWDSTRNRGPRMVPTSSRYVDSRSEKLTDRSSQYESSKRSQDYGRKDFEQTRSGFGYDDNRHSSTINRYNNPPSSKERNVNGINRPPGEFRPQSRWNRSSGERRAFPSSDSLNRFPRSNSRIRDYHQPPETQFHQDSFHAQRSSDLRFRSRPQLTLSQETPTIPTDGKYSHIPTSVHSTDLYPSATDHEMFYDQPNKSSLYSNERIRTERYNNFLPRYSGAAPSTTGNLNRTVSDTPALILSQTDKIICQESSNESIRTKTYKSFLPAFSVTPPSMSKTFNRNISDTSVPITSQTDKIICQESSHERMRTETYNNCLPAYSATSISMSETLNKSSSDTSVPIPSHTDKTICHNSSNESIRTETYNKCLPAFSATPPSMSETCNRNSSDTSEPIPSQTVKIRCQESSNGRIRTETYSNLLPAYSASPP